MKPYHLALTVHVYVTCILVKVVPTKYKNDDFIYNLTAFIQIVPNLDQDPSSMKAVRIFILFIILDSILTDLTVHKPVLNGFSASFRRLKHFVCQCGLF